MVDEALSVGDRKFAKKCRERVNSIIANENVTVLFVTHSTGTAKEFCHRGIVIQKGKAMFSGASRRPSTSTPPRDASAVPLTALPASGTADVH